MQGDILLGGLKQFGDFQLTQPDRLSLHPKVKPGLAVVVGVQNQFTHALFPWAVFSSLKTVMTYFVVRASTTGCSFLKHFVLY